MAYHNSIMVQVLTYHDPIKKSIIYINLTDIPKQVTDTYPQNCCLWHLENQIYL